MVDLFTEEERERLEKAVAAAEARTSAEIVVMVKRGATDYAAVEVMAAAIASLALPAALLPFTAIPAFVIWVAQLALFAILAILLPMVSAGRFLVGRERVARDVRAVAEAEFYAHGLRRTSKRAAVLLMVAMREHRIEVLADDAAQAVIDSIDRADWEEIIGRLAARLREGAVVEGLEDAVSLIADALETRLPPEEGKADELPNVIVH
ncbi:TPM domain-containing protein [Parvularcula lutaonensis]|uniref:TPM domain-containing protein n=1 Tax=Parvularcula lutaonensis TaxID=491923 RepID=A0ABV7MD98_9PROT|nr:hypothetical protein [Parvularcula lutaonensis]GGY52057.1 hypothetical protein GCM10007148_21360 [Parvularcula lutaonensis]